MPTQERVTIRNNKPYADVYEQVFTFPEEVDEGLVPGLSHALSVWSSGRLVCTAAFSRWPFSGSIAGDKHDLGGLYGEQEVDDESPSTRCLRCGQTMWLGPHHA